jgi:hypothetical protein
MMRSPSSNWRIQDFLLLPFATKWKYLVLLSPCRRLFTFDLWYHLISSSLNNCISLIFKQCLTSNSHGESIVILAFLSSYSIFCKISSFSFLYDPFIFLAHLLRYLRKDLILFCQISIELEPFTSHCHTSITFSWNPSLNNHTSSNLKLFAFGCDGSPVSNNNGV